MLRELPLVELPRGALVDVLNCVLNFVADFLSCSYGLLRVVWGTIGAKGEGVFTIFGLAGHLLDAFAHLFYWTSLHMLFGLVLRFGVVLVEMVTASWHSFLTLLTEPFFKNIRLCVLGQ